VTDPCGLFSAPRLLAPEHDLSDFDSGEPSLDEWLKKRALANAAIGASRTYLTCRSGSLSAAGFYAIAMGQILNQEATGAMRRNMPLQIPAIMLGRLAVDRKSQGQGLGKMLLTDAVQRSLMAAAEVSARLIVVHALSPDAEAFYRRFGFSRLPVATPMLALDLVKFQRATR
jgi:GNAT superfamily N-acetyltransferase